MNILFNTVSIGIHVFWPLLKALRDEGSEVIDQTGYFVTNKDIYEKFITDNPDFIGSTGPTLSESSILEEARSLKQVDFEYIEKFEKSIGDATLWNAVICDRRFNFPIRAQFIQDYRPAYDQEFILKVLQVALRRINEHFEEVKPDVVIGQNSVTLYDYIYCLMARSRGIPFFQLKLTRIQNYVSLYTDPLDVSPHLRKRIDDYVLNPDKLQNNKELFEKVRAFAKISKDSSLVYEGAISKKKQNNNGKGNVAKKIDSSSTTNSAVEAARNPFFKRLKNLLLNVNNDPHYPSSLHSLYYRRIIKPVRKKLIKKFIFESTDQDWNLDRHKHKYAVYPLNTEPEVALLVYGRSYRNQIETVRNIAASLPVGWKLAVKEHPNAIGYRSFGFYKKLRQIPNVVLLGPTIDTHSLISGSELVFVVFGTIGLEAILKKKPVITFSRTPYGTFPEKMVKYVDNMAMLSEEIKQLMSHYEFDEWALYSYIAAHIDGSVPINLSTGLLGKAGRERLTLDEPLSEQYKKLAHYTLGRICEEKERL